MVKKMTWLKCWFAFIGCMLAASSLASVLGHEGISDTLAMAALSMTIPCFGGPIILSALGMLNEQEMAQ